MISLFFKKHQRQWSWTYTVTQPVPMSIFWRIVLKYLFCTLFLEIEGVAYGESHNRHMKEHEKTISWMAPLLIIEISTRYSSVTFGWPQDLTTESSYIIYCLQVYLNWFRLLLVYFTTYPFYTYCYFIVHIVIFTHCSHTFLSINM